MPVDTSIYSNLLRPPKSVAEYDAEARAAQMDRMNLLAARQKMTDMDEARQERTSIQEALKRAGPTMADRIGTLRGLGSMSAIKMADEMEKGDLDRRHKESQIGTSESQNAERAHGLRVKQREFGVQLLQGAYNPQGAAQILQEGVKNGSWNEQEATQALQALQQMPLEQWKQGFLRTVLAPEKLLPKVENRDAGGTVQTLAIDPLTGQPKITGSVQKTMTPDQIADNSRQWATFGETKRHNRAMEGFRGQEVKTSANGAKAPAGYQWAPDGSRLMPIAGGPADPTGKPKKDLTDSQAKANLFGSRMVESDRILSELDGKYSPAAVNAKVSAERTPIVGGTLGWVGNLALSEKAQQAEQAQRDFINAVLRRESGAVIADSEFANAAKQYFPQPGDSKVVKEQKARNRKLAIDGILAEVPAAHRGAPTLSNPGREGGAPGGWEPPSVDAIEAELRRRGGK